MELEASSSPGMSTSVPNSIATCTEIRQHRKPTMGSSRNILSTEAVGGGYGYDEEGAHILSGGLPDLSRSPVHAENQP